MATAICNPSDAGAPPTPRKGKRKRPQHTDLIALRINEGLSREQLGYRCAVSRETIRMAEAGFLPNVRVQFAIAKALGCRPLDLWPMERQGAGR